MIDTTITQISKINHQKKNSWAVKDMADDRATAGMKVLLESIFESVPPPCTLEKTKEPFTFSVNNIGFDSFIGKLVTGKVTSGTISVGQKVHVLRRSPNEHNPTAAVEEAAAPSALMPITHIFCIRNGVCSV
jgi:predicted membrane GTPase involved in stress response